MQPPWVHVRKLFRDFFVTFVNNKTQVSNSTRFKFISNQNTQLSLNTTKKNQNGQKVGWYGHFADYYLHLHLSPCRVLEGWMH